MEGNINFSDAGNNRVRKLSNVQGNGPVAYEGITTIAGDGTQGCGGDGVDCNSGDEDPAIEARLYNLTGLAVDDEGSIFIADSGNVKN
jgi:hypothetical protein